MEQLIAHLFGDYLTQSDWMANNKTSKSFACVCHALVYGIGFYIIGASWSALFVIVATHFLLDRFRLAKYVVYAKNFLAPPSIWIDENCTNKTSLEWSEKGCTCKYSWENCKATGYPSETPPFLAVWLLIIADNTIHLFINYLAIKFL